MRKWIAFAILIAVVFLVWNRQRLYVRDPLANVLRDGVKEKGAQVYINYSNDALLANYNAPMYVELVQKGGRMGTPAVLHCVMYLACLLDADTPALLDGSSVGNVVSMSNRQVQFRDAKGRDVVVTLR